MGQGIAAVDRAREDVAAGRPWKARERLRAYVSAHPTDEPARDLLGAVLYDMRDLPAAGAVWALTTRDDERSREAFAALRAAQPRMRGLVGALRVTAPVDAWPPPVQERLRALQAEAAAHGVRWEPGPARERPEAETSGNDTLALVGCLLVVAAFAACAVIGLVTAVGWLV